LSGLLLTHINILINIVGMGGKIVFRKGQIDIQLLTGYLGSQKTFIVANTIKANKARRMEVRTRILSFIRFIEITSTRVVN